MIEALKPGFTYYCCEGRASEGANNSQFINVVSGSGDAYTARIWGDSLGELVFLTNHLGGNTNTITIDNAGNLLLSNGLYVESMKNRALG
jgi:hypothetical protein